MMSFDFSPPDVRPGLYEEPRVSYPTIIWRIQGDEEGSPGYFAVRADRLDECPPGWSEYDIRYGTNPTATPEPSFVTRRLRISPIAVRKRYVVKSHDGTEHSVPFYTPRQVKQDELDMESQKGHIQVLGVVPGVSEPLVMGLWGYTKNTAWTNNPQGKYGSDKFPMGVEEQLREYAKQATTWQRKHNAYDGLDIPWLVAWWIDLVPLAEELKGKRVATFIDVGHGTYANPFTIDMTISKELNIESRYVGPDIYDVHESLRENVGVPWEKEFEKQFAIEAVTEDENGYDGSEPMGTVEDDIPF